MKTKLLAILMASVFSFGASAGQIYFKLGDFPFKFKDPSVIPPDTEEPPVIPPPVEDLSDGRLPGTLAIGDTCKDILNSGKSKGDGDYTVLIPGVKTAVYCDMTTNSGGWMLLNDYGSATPYKNALGKVGINKLTETTATFTLSQMLLNFNGVPQGTTPIEGSLFNRPDSVSFSNSNASGRATARLRLPGYGTAFRIDAPRVGPTNTWSIQFSGSPTQNYGVVGSFGGTAIMTYFSLSNKTVIDIEETNGVIQLDKTWVR